MATLNYLARQSFFLVILATAVDTAAATKNPAALNRFYAGNEDILSLDGIWLFHGGDNMVFSKSTLDDHDWEQRQLPIGDAKWSNRWQGYAWYRLHFSITERLRNSDLMISLGPCREAAEVYVNGALVATRGQFGSRVQGGAWVLPLQGLIPAGLLQPANVVAVRLYDPTWHGGLISGPLLLGVVNAVQKAAEAEPLWVLMLRLALVLIALTVGGGYLIYNYQRDSREVWSFFGAALSLAVMLLDGTGVLARFSPSVDLAARLPVAVGPLAVLFFVRFFVLRYSTLRPRIIQVAQAFLLLLSAAELLAPDWWVFLFAPAILFVASLTTLMYAATILSRAARHNERETLPLFGSLIGLVVLVVYDGLRASQHDIAPPLGVVGAVIVLLLTAVSAARKIRVDATRTLLQMLYYKRRLEAQNSAGLLEITALSITDPRAFLDAVVHEAARELEVRRCSLMLESREGALKVVACVGLPKQAIEVDIPKDTSIAGFAFSRGQTITPSSVPDFLKANLRQRNYTTQGFVAEPLRLGARVLGVLNVSDRNDGDIFNASHEQLVAAVAARLALVISRIGLDHKA